MRRSKKDNERIEQVRKGKKGPAKIEPIRPASEQVLKKSEEIFPSVFDTSLIGVAVCLPDKRWLYVNDRICEILGYSREELCRMTWDKLTHPEDLEADVSQFNRLLAGEIDKYELEKRFIRKDGSVVYARIYISCKRNEKGEFEYDIGLLEDITERKQVEGALRTSEERLNAAMGAAELGIWDWDLISGQITWAGHHARLLGLKEEEFDGRYETFEKRVHPEDIAGLDSAVEKAKNECSEYSFEYRVIWPDGTVRWILGKGRCQYDDIGRPIRMLGTVHDITDRKFAERELLASEVRFRELFNNMSSGVAVYEAVDDGSDFVFRDFNKAAEKIDKIGKGEVTGKRITEVFPYVREFGLLEVFRRVWKTGKAKRHPMTFYKDGRISGWRENYVYKLPGGDIVAVYDDVSEREQAEQTLRESEERYRSLFENSLEGIGLSKGNRVIDANPALLDMFGYDSLEEFLKVPLLEHVAPESRSFIKDQQRKFQKGEPTDNRFEYKIICKNGKKRDMEISVGYIQIGNDIYAQSSFRDITERKRAEEALSESEERFRGLFEQSADAIVVLDTQKNLMDFNDKACEMYGYTREEFQKLQLSDIEMIENMDDILAHSEKIVKQGSDIFETKHKTKDGTILDVLVSAKAITIGNKKFIQSVWRDITQIKKSEEKLQQERNLLRTLIDHIPDAVFVKDKDGRFVLCNKMLADRWKENGVDNIIGKTDFELFEKTEAKQFFDEEQEVMKTGRPLVNREGQFVHNAGKVFYGLTTKVPLRDGSGNVIGIVGINRDISGRKTAEDKLLENQKQLKRLASQLALAEERERRRIAGELHDQIGQAMALAKIKLDALRSSSTSRPADEVLADLSETLQRLIDETRSLTFDLSYPILYEIGFEAAVSDWLNEQVQGKNDITVEFADDGLDKPLDDDIRILLFRNVRELLINCIKHSNAERVKVGIRRIDGSIEVTVEDNGIGFDPVEAGTMTTPKVGFGLFSIRESLEELGGRLEIESKPGAGYKVIMTAPLEGQPRKKEE